jgi:hypothetical protein
MNHDLFNISLNQGKQFNNYQGKIKTSVEKQIYGTKSKRVYKKEGFTNNTNIGLGLGSRSGSSDLLQQRDDRAKIINQSNQADLDELTNLQTQYNDLQTQYNDTQKRVNSSGLVSINRTSVNNPYLNNNISLSQDISGYPVTDLGYGGYVSGQGVFKPYPDQATFDSVAGKNGCPKDIMSNIPVNDYSSSLLQGQPMVANQSCGKEGKNVYVSKLVDNPTSSYVGCYNDKPTSTNGSMVPLMNTSNIVNGFMTGASSVYQNNNTLYGAWAAFDQNPNTFWHAGVDSNNLYTASTGVYQGTNSIPINTVNSGILTIKGEFLQVDMPGVNTNSVQNMTVTKYSIAPRADNNLFLQRSPNTWYLLGYKDTWYEVDRQVGQNFSSITPKTYDVANPGSYGAYIIIVEKVGNDDQTSIRDCLQIAELNLYVNSDSTFTDADRAMIYNSSAIGYTTFDNCKKYAIDNNYQYFGLQDLQPDGTAQCLVSNDYDRTIGYGDGSKQQTSFALWSSNTSGQTYTMQVSGIGKIIIYDINTAIVFNSNEDVAECTNWGTIYVDSATYGGNCNTSSVQIGNVTDKVGADLKCNYMDSCSIPISNGTFGDPAVGCSKSFDVAYKCGGNAFTRNLTPAEGQTMILDCNEHIKTNCLFCVILQDDGDLCLYKGKDPSVKTDLVWSSGTKGLQKSPNSSWVASKGKFGRNYMMNGETLVADEWIGSDDGSIKLMMQKDGNLVLYASEEKSGCSVSNNQTFGSALVNAVYKIDQIGNKAVLGKIAYIDEETKLREYPSSLLTKSNQYQLFNDFDSFGNDIQQIASNTAEQGCIDACNTNGDCSGFVYQPNGNLCYLKNSGMYPSGEKQYYSNSGLILGVRKPQVNSAINSSCNKDIVDIDSIQYDNYIKGELMTTDTMCGSPLVLTEDRTNLTNLQNSMLSIGQQIADQSDNLYNENNDMYNTISKNSTDLNKNINMYKRNDNKIKAELNLPVNNNFKSKPNKEGMKNIKNTNEKNITMNDINSMLSDTDIRVLQENYGYIFWSILAIGLLTVTINQIKK